MLGRPHFMQGWKDWIPTLPRSGSHFLSCPPNTVCQCTGLGLTRCPQGNAHLLLWNCISCPLWALKVFFTFPQIHPCIKTILNNSSSNFKFPVWGRFLEIRSQPCSPVLFILHSFTYATNISLSTQPSAGLDEGDVDINKTCFLLLGAHRDAKALEKVIGPCLEK